MGAPNQRSASSDWRAALAERPRVALALLPTPLTFAPRLSEAIGAELWLKRDDVGSLGLMGNKVRKLEFALGAAIEQGADAIVTLGAPQSNHCRATAAACAQLGLEAHLLLRETPPDDATGNLLLDRLFGAHVSFAEGDWAQLAEPLEEILARLRAEGRTPVLLPAGCSSAEGALGFVAAYDELLGQLDALGLEPARVFHASTSGGTHAGLALGHALAGRGPVPDAFEVGMLYDDPAAVIIGLARGAAELLGAPPGVTVTLSDAQLGDGYGARTAAADEAITLAARSEGLLFDPVYSGKALAGVIEAARDAGGPLLLWHTGGGPSLFATGFAHGL